MEEFKRESSGLETYVEMLGIDLYALIENEKDQFFWKKIFEMFLPEKEICFDSVATSAYFDRNKRGKESLIEFLDEINTNIQEEGRNENVTNWIVAWDADYDIFSRGSIKGKQVIDTYGYTIENTLFCPHKLTRIVLDEIPLNNLNYDRILSLLELEYKKIEEELSVFISYNFAARIKNKKGEEVPEVMGRSSDRYMNQNKTSLDNEKVTKKVTEVSQIIENSYYEKAESIINKSDLDFRFIISGHFLETLIQRKVEQIVKAERRSIKKRLDNDKNISEKYNIQIETLRKLANEKCSIKCKNSEECKDFNYMKRNIEIKFS